MYAIGGERSSDNAKANVEKKKKIDDSAFKIFNSVCFNREETYKKILR